MQVSPARQARGGPEPVGPREQGFVAKFQDTYGFIRCAEAHVHLEAPDPRHLQYAAERCCP